jgi:hypothetical protein
MWVEEITDHTTHKRIWIGTFHSSQCASMAPMRSEPPIGQPRLSGVGFRRHRVDSACELVEDMQDYERLEVE